jgi:hypothetical protein
MLVEGNFTQVKEYMIVWYQWLRIPQCFPAINLTFEIASYKKLLWRNFFSFFDESAKNFIERNKCPKGLQLST